MHNPTETAALPDSVTLAGSPAPLEPPERTCKTCTHWKVLKTSSEHGVCKARSPSAIPAQVQGIMGPNVVFIGHWPTTAAGESCDLDYELRPVPVPVS